MSEMTLEELKAEARKYGYHLVKDIQNVKILPCPVCGSKKTSEWYLRGGLKVRKCYNFHVVPKLCKCTFEGTPGKTSIEAKQNWNEAVLKYKKEEEERIAEGICDAIDEQYADY